MALTYTVVDLSHYDVIQSNGFDKLARGGYKGVVNKATQGTGIVDITYASRRRDCVDSGLAYGCYHFGDNSDPVAQADHFLAVAQPDDSTLLALDWEPNGAHTMSNAQAKVFLDRVCEKTGRHPFYVYIYGGSLLKEQITSAADCAYFGQYKLWLSQYAAKPKLPKAWSSYTIWQASGDGQGPGPHDAPGITIPGGVDQNVVCEGFDFDKDWGIHNLPPPAAVGIADLVSVSRKAQWTWGIKRAWQGLTGASLMSYLGMSKDTYNQVSTVFHDHWLVILVTVGVLSILAVKAIEALMVDDINSGRSVPSGAA